MFVGVFLLVCLVLGFVLQDYFAFILFVVFYFFCFCLLFFFYLLNFVLFVCFCFCFLTLLQNTMPVDIRYWVAVVV